MESRRWTYYSGRPLANMLGACRYLCAAHLLCYCRETSQSCQFLVGRKQHEGLYEGELDYELVNECE